MKKILILCLSVILLGLFLTSGCKKKEKTEPTKEETSQTTPTEPAPVPEGTPKY